MCYVICYDQCDITGYLHAQKLLSVFASCRQRSRFANRAAYLQLHSLLCAKRQPFSPPGWLICPWRATGQASQGSPSQRKCTKPRLSSRFEKWTRRGIFAVTTPVLSIFASVDCAAAMAPNALLTKTSAVQMVTVRSENRQ